MADEKENDYDGNVIQELMNEGLSIEQAKNIISASNDQQLTISSRLSIAQEIEIHDDPNLMKESMDDGLSIEEAKNVIAASNNEHMNVQPVYQCICGQNLSDVKNGFALYDGRGAYCLQCEELVPLHNTIWHCEQKNDRHQAGFDICNKCICSYNPQLFGKEILPQFSNMRCDTANLQMSSQQIVQKMQEITNDLSSDS